MEAWQQGPWVGVPASTGLAWEAQRWLSQRGRSCAHQLHTDDHEIVRFNHRSGQEEKPLAGGAWATQVWGLMYLRSFQVRPPEPATFRAGRKMTGKHCLRQSGSAPWGRKDTTPGESNGRLWARDGFVPLVWMGRRRLEGAVHLAGRLLFLYGECHPSTCLKQTRRHVLHRPWRRIGPGSRELEFILEGKAFFPRGGKSGPGAETGQPSAPHPCPFSPLECQPGPWSLPAVTGVPAAQDPRHQPPPWTAPWSVPGGCFPLVWGSVCENPSGLPSRP